MSGRPDSTSAAEDGLEVLCSNCVGACCREQQSPPGYVLWIDPDKPPEYGDWVIDRPPPDLPRDLLLELVEYARSRTKVRPFGSLPDPACFWLTPEGQCRGYQWRPPICRDFEVGEEGCLAWRKDYGVE
jgi:Fe-S-cluster containining protein